ncbi:MAG: phosphoribosylanthranilate isomerase [Huintestinicola sp.]|uniref:phosphoribosylanthranilate isomerase n=1 Tax=Huintestinicola sp. TaxID=2981661 RepID=UPI003F02E5F5
MIKLCGIRRREDVSIVNEFLPDYIGMILTEGFRRTVDMTTAEELSRLLDKRIKKVGVFVNEPGENVKCAAERLGLDVIQLHGDEDGEYIRSLPVSCEIWKAVRVRSSEDILRAEKLGCDRLLLDSFVKNAVGGTGIVADWDIIKNTNISLPYFLAGGIGEDNIGAALKICPDIDLSGSVETDGVKDREKIRRITELYRDITQKGIQI